MKKLLYIEHDPLNSRAYIGRFTDAGYEVELADDGEMGLAAATRFRPDVIVLNYSLPDMSGQEVILKIRAVPDISKTPIIVIAHDSSGRVEEAARKAGATRCLIAGRYTDKDLFRIIRESLQRREQPVFEAAETNLGLLKEEPSAQVAARPPAPSSNTQVWRDLAAMAGASGRPSATGGKGVAKIIKLARSLFQTEDAAQQESLVGQIVDAGETLAAESAGAGQALLARMAACLAALAQELAEKPLDISPSNRRTIKQTSEFMTVLSEQAGSIIDMDWSAIRVLAVDDSVVALSAVKSALALIDLIPATAKDPREALLMIEKESHDLFVLDVMMPVMTGFDLCVRIREFAAHKKTPIVFATSCNDFQSRVRFAKVGGDDFIAKPYLGSELAAKVMQHLLRGRVAREEQGSPEVFRAFSPLGGKLRPSKPG